jgi:hypothetical protein
MQCSLFSMTDNLVRAKEYKVNHHPKTGSQSYQTLLNNLNFQSRSYRNFFFTDMETTFLGKFDKFVMKEAQEVNVLSGIQFLKMTS